MSIEPKKADGEAPEAASTLDSALRPRVWEEYIGQEKVKENLSILIEAARGRGHAPEHLLFYGPPGLGKTTLAHLIAHDLGATMKATSGPAIERVGDLAAILTNLAEGDILFIDEIHRLNRSIEEVLYPALESGVLDIVIGKGPSARTLQLPLPAFTLVAATTRIALLSSPLRSRFSGGMFRLDFYREEDISKILARSARILGIETEEDALLEIAARARATPRTANYLLKRARDFAQVRGVPLTKGAVRDALALLEIDDAGLGKVERTLLTTLIDVYAGGPVGLATLAAATAEEDATIEEVYEPYLMREGFLERTARGRIASKRAYTHLGKRPPETELF